jgi:hypothetical protein
MMRVVAIVQVQPMSATVVSIRRARQRPPKGFGVNTTPVVTAVAIPEGGIAGHEAGALGWGRYSQMLWIAMN